MAKEATIKSKKNDKNWYYMEFTLNHPQVGEDRVIKVFCVESTKVEKTAHRLIKKSYYPTLNSLTIERLGSNGGRSPLRKIISNLWKVFK